MLCCFVFFVACPKLGGLIWPTMSGKARMISYYVGSRSKQVGSKGRYEFLTIPKSRAHRLKMPTILEKKEKGTLFLAVVF